MALAITALLLTATMVATDASFKAYAAAAESASTRTATRMVVNRLLTLIRTSTAHGPTEPGPEATPVRWDPDANAGAGDWTPVPYSNTLESSYIEVIDPKGDHLRIEYRLHAPDQSQLWLVIDRDTTGDGTYDQHDEQPLLGGVNKCRFLIHRRRDNQGVYVLDRATIDLEVEPDEDDTLAIESDTRTPIHAVASTMPRKLE